jgi:hypothetical protein
VILPGITSSWKLIQTGKIKMCEKSSKQYCKGQLFLKFKSENLIKMKNKPDPALVGGSNLFNEIKKGHQTLVRLSL